MVSGVEATAGRLAGQAALRAGRGLLESRERRRLSEAARALIPARSADQLLSELSVDEAAALASFLDAPDFEHLALQIILAMPAVGRRSEIMVEVRHQLREGIRATGIGPEQLTGVTDVVFDALTVACHVVASDVTGGPRASAEATVAVQTHLAAMAARNGRLLAGLANVHEIRDTAVRLRKQVGVLRGRIHLSHTGVNRSVPWERLFVQPALRLMHSDGVDGVVPTTEELSEPGRRSVLLGDPGAGKSTLMAKLAYDAAIGPRPLTPFLVVLRDLAETLRVGDRTFVDCLAMAARVPYGVDMATDGIEYLIMNGRALVLIDGLDELTDLSLRGRVAETIDGFATLYPLVSIIATSRQVGYTDAALNSDLFRSYVIASFDNERVERYARNWFDLDDGTPPDERQARCAMFLQESESISDLRSNPLLLSLLCSGYATERHLPRNRAQVYERCATTLFDRWDSMRGVPMPVRFHGHVRGGVVELAWEMFAVRNVTELSRYRALTALRRYLVGKRIDEDEAEAMAEGFLAFCAGRAWILAEVGTAQDEPVYGFAHRTFLEYFAAEHLVRRHSGPDAVWAAIGPRLGVPNWAVAAQLVVQLLDRNVDDGGELLVELALAEAERAAPERRFDLGAFLAGAVGHLALSRATLDQIVAVCIANSRTIEVDDRYMFWPREDIYRRATRRDGPFKGLLYSSLDANLPGLRGCLERQLAAGAAAGDDHTLYLIHNLTRYSGPSGNRARVDYWGGLEEELRNQHSEAFAAWWQRRAWGRLWGTGDDPAAVPEMIRRFDVAPFYTGDVYAGGMTAAGVSIMLTVGESEGRRPGVTGRAIALRDDLLGRHAPWISGKEWWPQLAACDAWLERWMAQRLYAPWPDGEDRGTFAVLCLPWLESAEKLRDQGFTPAADALIRARKHYQESKEFDLKLLNELPERCRSLIEEWVCGRCVIGP